MLSVYLLLGGWLPYIVGHVEGNGQRELYKSSKLPIVVPRHLVD